jgi:hypothetical protein
VDAFCMRAGDVLQAGIVSTGELTALSITGFAAINVVCVLGWIAVASGLERRLRNRPEGTEL